jgi:gliding motility-associated-like protein
LTFLNKADSLKLELFPLKKILPPVILCLLFAQTAMSQANLEVTITGGEATTTCTDIFSAPDPLWQVNIENQGWNTYPDVGNCFNALPHTPYSEAFDCPFDLPPTIEICFKAFENDGFFGCQIAEDCTEQVCQPIPVPTSGQVAYRLDLPGGGESEGYVEFTLTISGNYLGQNNDEICDAYDLGVLSNGNRVGNALAGGFNNFCGTPTNDPNPVALNPGSFRNDAGVWFVYETGPNPSGMHIIQAINDPTNLGDSINLQMALFESSTGDCTGNLTMIDSKGFGNDFDIHLNLRCPQPNTKYFILIDGWDWNLIDQRGYFGIEVIDIGLPEGGDLRCDFVDLGPVPVGSYTATATPYTNYCATDIGDPFASGFVVQKSVYFAFNAPPSGHIRIDVVSDKIIDSIGCQIVLYQSLNDQCTGFFSQIQSAFDLADLDESMELSCLDPGRRYFLLIDGDGFHPSGIFTVRISDLGDDTPVTFLTDTICSGERYPVGNSLYNQTGNYIDTILFPNGCDSVIYLDLTVLPPIHFSATQTARAQGLNNPSGEFVLVPRGGLVPYNFLWSDGQMGPQASGLLGGQTYCVTVTDDFGCQNDTCLYVEYITPILPDVQITTISCNGLQDGALTIGASNGVPPYNFTWVYQGSPPLQGNGSLSSDTDVEVIPNLPGGNYSISIADAFTDTIFTVTIFEPDPIELTNIAINNASCYGVCDGSINLTATGGTGTLNFQWSNAASGPNLNNLCAGDYFLTITDENACTVPFRLPVTEPDEFVATVQIVQDIPCFGDSAGVLAVITNGNPVNFSWNNTPGTDTLFNQPSGNYTVQVTNQDGCMDTTDIFLPQPATPLAVNINVEQPIICNGGADGVLSANPVGPGNSFTYSWSDFSNTSTVSGLDAGQYAVSIENERGCVAVDSLLLQEPPLIATDFSITHLNCLNPVNGGALEIVQTSGGQAPYQYSLDGISYQPSNRLTDLMAGVYDLWVKDNLGCEKSFPLEVLPPPDIQVSLGDDESIVLGETIGLSAFTNSPQPSFQWLVPNPTCSNPECSAVLFQPLTSGLYEVVVTDSASFCKASDAIFIEVINDLRVYVPNAFSPNGDGINDYFTVFADNSIAQVNYLRIFDRFGALIFEKTDFTPNQESSGWDGSYKGKRLDTGTYVWMVEVEFIDGTTELFKGDISIFQ